MKIESCNLNRIRMMIHLVAARHSHSGCATRRIVIGMTVDICNSADLPDREPYFDRLPQM